MVDFGEVYDQDGSELFVSPVLVTHSFFLAYYYYLTISSLHSSVRLCHCS